MPQDRLVANLDAWCSRDWGAVPDAAAVALAKVGRLPAMQQQLDIKGKFMGRWYVAANIPTYFEAGASNCVEDYIWNEEEQHIQVRFAYTKPGGGEGVILQRAKIASELGTEWTIW